jgi:hypothetical protein
MNVTRMPILNLGLSILMAAPTIVYADYTVSCKSHGYKNESCRLSEPGYVTLERQTSSSDCQKGRTWDYNRHEIWVDDGCAGDFRVETHSGGSKNNSAKVAGAVAGLAILGLLASNQSHKDDAKYQDENYYGARHTSYVPGWMVGRFLGYNPMYGAEVTMTIERDGRVRANTSGETLTGWINDEELHVGSAIFHINQTRDGFITAQKGDWHNEVRYHRID